LKHFARRSILGPVNAITFLLLAAAAARADTVYLKNGNELEGFVLSQADGQVVVDVGYGTTTLDRAAVERIVIENNAELANERQQRRFEAGEDVPAAAKALDALLRRAEAQRETMLDARLHLRELAGERARIQARRPAALHTERTLAALVAQAGGDISRKPGLAAQLNVAHAERDGDRLRLEQLQSDEDEARGRVHAFLETLSAVRARAEGADRDLLAKSRGPYYDWLRPRLKAAQTGVVRDAIPSERGPRDTIIVKALINGRVEGRFLVDTGATMTLLYKNIADALGLEPTARTGSGQTRVADGRTVETDIFMLDAIEVGRSKAHGTEAAVLPFSMSGIDGLLGMSFLNRFVARVDGANGRLLLEDVK
jgi:clan AA aspartic protease (TIGR02281 family)